MTMRKKPLLDLRHLLIFAMLGAMMFASKKIMESLPNIHLLGLLIMAYTLVYRAYALLPIYIYVLLDGIFLGFNPAWLPYLYIWAILWGVTMLLPKRMPNGVAVVVYALVCALHGLSFGLLYAPAQMLLFHLSPKATLAWIAAGFPFDLTHGISNFCTGLLVLPLSNLLRQLEQRLI